MQKYLNELFNQVSAFFTQNNLLGSNQSGSRSGHTAETALLSVVEALRLARADSKSSILILLDLSAAFDTVNHQILLSSLLAKGISGTALQWFESYLSDRSFKVSWWGVQVATSNYWGTTGLSSWTTSLLVLHGITRFCHSETWLFISLLCWFHSTLPLIPSWRSEDSCSYLGMSNRHFLLDEGPSPLTQPCQERTACGSIKPITSSQFYHPVRLIHNSFKHSQKPWSFDWSADFLRPQCFIWHQEDQALSFGMCYTTSCSISCSVQARLLQCSLGKTSSQFYQASATNLAARVVFYEPKRVTPLFINLHWLPIAAHIKFKALMRAYKTTTGSAPLYLNSLLQTYVPSRSLPSASEQHILVPSQRDHILIIVWCHIR